MPAPLTTLPCSYKRLTDGPMPCSHQGGQQVAIPDEQRILTTAFSFRGQSRSGSSGHTSDPHAQGRADPAFRACTASAGLE